MDTADVYASTRAGLLALAEGLDGKQPGSPVPALPGWTVKDTFAHLTGLCADVLDGRMDGAGSPGWTARQLEERADRDLSEVAAEWATLGPGLDQWLRAPGRSGTAFVAFDVWTHEQDIRGALGLSGERGDGRVGYLSDEALTVFDRRFAQAGAPALRVVAGSGGRILGEGEPRGTLRVDGYELLRVLFGRRSQAQVVAEDWEGDPDLYVGHLHLFDLPIVDLVD